MKTRKRWADTTPEERREAKAWLVDRIDEMRPDRRSIKAERGCDLVAVLDSLTREIVS